MSNEMETPIHKLFPGQSIKVTLRTVCGGHSGNFSSYLRGWCGTQSVTAASGVSVLPTGSDKGVYWCREHSYWVCVCIYYKGKTTGPLFHLHVHGGIVKGRQERNRKGGGI